MLKELKELKMRATQLASGDYRACGLMAEEIGKDMFKTLDTIIKRLESDELVEVITRELWNAYQDHDHGLGDYDANKRKRPEVWAEVMRDSEYDKDAKAALQAIRESE